MKKIKLFFLIPDMGFGGAQRQLTELIIQLVKRDNLEITLCTIINNFELWKEVDSSISSKVNVITLNKKKGKLHNIQAFIYLIIKLHRTNPHIIHAYLGRAIRFSMIAKLFYPRKKLIIAFRNAIKVKTRLFGLEKINFHRIFRFTVNINTCNSLAALEGARIYFGYSNEKSFCIPNGIDTKSFYPKTKDNKNTKTKLLLPGRIIEQKNQMSILRAITTILKTRQNSTPCFEVLFVGEVASKTYFEEIIQFISFNNLNEIVKILPPTTNILKYYHEADIILLPSLHEGFPNVLLESWACKKPVLISKEADTASIVKPNHGGWTFNVANTEDLTKKLNLILQLDSGQIINQGELGYKIATNRYSISQITDRYYKLYSELY